MKDETPLNEIMEKPLSTNIIDEMADADDADRLDLILYLEGVNGMQAQLISRMLKSLKVEHTAFTEDEFTEVLNRALEEKE